MQDVTRARLDAFFEAAGRRPLVMGVLNVTPDSFSDGGRFEAPDVAVARAEALAAAGAAVVDIGGESTRPGFTPVPADLEGARVLPVIAGLTGRISVPLSIDTTKATVARAALAQGAAIVNDIWGFQGADPALPDIVAEAGAGAILMHNRAAPDPAIDILDDLCRFFEVSLARAERAGVVRARLILDPGIGFGKTPQQQLQVIAGLGRLGTFGLPILVGISRKSILGRITGAAPDRRGIETLAAHLAAAAAGATLFRVHDVAEHVAALRVFDAFRTGLLA